MAFSTNGGWFPIALRKHLSNTVDFVAATKKVMIVSAAPTGAEEFVSELTEVSTGGYTGGYGGASRQTLSGSFTFGSDVSDLDALLVTLAYGTNVTWAALGTPGDTIAGWVILTETGGADTSSIPWIFIPVTGGSYTLEGAAETWEPPASLATANLSGA